MLQPKRYPELMGKALVLDPDPFVTLADDDNPWMEGLFMVVLVGVALSVAHLLRGLLLTASLPPADAISALLWQSWRDLLAIGTASSGDLTAAEDAFRQSWDWSANLAGLQGGVARLFYALFPPLFLLLLWLIYGVVSHGTARLLGGQGRLTQTLGATALIAAPYLLVLLTVIPFVAVSRVLLAIWALLIAYRAIEVVHDLSWQRATFATLAALLLPAILFAAGGVMLFSLLVGVRGVMP